MKIKAFSTLGEISHFTMSGYFVISGFDITGVDCIFKQILLDLSKRICRIQGDSRVYMCLPRKLNFVTIVIYCWRHN